MNLIVNSDDIKYFQQFSSTATLLLKALKYVVSIIEFINALLPLLSLLEDGKTELS